MSQRISARLVTLVVPLILGQIATGLAATVDGIDGVVMVNHGKGFVSASGPVDVAAGAKVMAKPGGSALLVYSAGCVVPVRAGSVVSVSSAQPCPETTRMNWKVEINTQVSQVSEAAAANPPGAVEPVAPVEPGSESVEPPASSDGQASAANSGWSTGELVVGGVVVGGGVAAAAVLASKKSNSTPASP
jgi:hypothetical protein